jgi:hypothetical protein
MLLLMKVNLLQGTYTPQTHAHAGRTPGRARDRRPFADLFELTGLVWAAARDSERYCDTRSQVCTIERQEERMIQS